MTHMRTDATSVNPKLVAATEAAKTLERGRFYQESRFPMLRQQMKPMALWTASQGCDLALLFPFNGFMQGMLHRGIYKSWRARFFGWVLNSVLKKHRGQAGSNDELMARWFMTGEGWIVERLYAIAATVPPEGADFNGFMRHHTARWMLHSVRANHVDLNIELMDLEMKAGADLKPPDPLELAKWVGARDSMEPLPADPIGDQWQG